MESRVMKWGNSLGVRIPHSIAKDLGIKENTPVEISVEDDCLTVRPSKTFNLDTLLSRITSKNVHKEFDTGPAIGRELW